MKISEMSTSFYTAACEEATRIYAGYRLTHIPNFYAYMMGGEL